LSWGHASATTIYKYTDAYGVTSYTDRPTHGAKVLVFADRMNERLDQQVHLDVNRQAGITTFSARNELYAPVEVELPWPTWVTCARGRRRWCGGYCRRARR